METFIYFVRHAESIYVEGMERTRGLSEKGKLDAITVQSILRNENIDLFTSSPYERSIQTIQGLAKEQLKNIMVFDDLREREIGNFFEFNFKDAKREVYDEFEFSFPNGESSRKAQKRAIAVLDHLLDEYEGKKILIGTHGDIMTLMMNYFDKKYDFEFWESTSMPDIYKLEFAGKKLIHVTRQWE